MLGWDQKVQQAPQSISLITTIDDLEELTEKSGGGGLEGRVQHRQQVLDRAFQRIKVLETQEREGKIRRRLRTSSCPSTYSDFKLSTYAMKEGDMNKSDTTFCPQFYIIKQYYYLVKSFAF